MITTTALFGIGAAGNKAAIAALEANVINDEYVKLLNTTSKDIPEKYKVNNDKTIIFSSGLGGCGKEPTKGKKAIIRAIQNHAIDFGSLLPQDVKQVVLVTSTEGGTGCGATPIIAKYFEAMNIPVHVFAFIGFEDEARGINNTLKFFKELGDSNIILHSIMNSKFIIDGYNNSYKKAEESANKEFVNQLKILLGSNLVNSDQNIDNTDHYKINTTPGYMDIKHVPLKGTKNMSMSDKFISNVFDNNTCLEYKKGCKRLAVIIDASESVQDAIDASFGVIKRYVGEPYEIYRHTQNTGNGDYMDIIISGLPYPTDAISEINNKYNSFRDKISDENKDKPSNFNDIFGDLNLDDEDDEFDMDVRSVNQPLEATNIFNKKINNVV